MPKLRNEDVAQVLADVANAMMGRELNVHNVGTNLDVALVVTDFVEQQSDKFQDLYQSKLNFVEE
mgnify:CR=1 FL=1